jgi:hypothetical protein
MKVVATFVYRHQAEFAAGYLRAEGIHAFVRADDAGGLHPGLGFTRAARIVVAEPDFAAARAVLLDAGVLEGDDDSDAPDAAGGIGYDADPDYAVGADDADNFTAGYGDEPDYAAGQDEPDDFAAGYDDVTDAGRDCD